MNKRVFAAINLPLEIRLEIDSRLHEAESLWRESFSPRILDQSNWHITMGFFGDRSEAEIASIKKAVEKTAQKFNPPEIKLQRIIFGPTRGVEARMIWLEAISENLASVKKEFDINLQKQGINSEDRGRDFSPHITLARFNPIAFNLLPRLDEDVGLIFKAKSLDLMESRLSSGGSVYSSLFEIDFKVG